MTTRNQTNFVSDTGRQILRYGREIRQFTTNDVANLLLVQVDQARGYVSNLSRAGKITRVVDRKTGRVVRDAFTNQPVWKITRK